MFLDAVPKNTHNLVDNVGMPEVDGGGAVRGPILFMTVHPGSIHPKVHIHPPPTTSSTDPSAAKKNIKFTERGH